MPRRPYPHRWFPPFATNPTIQSTSPDPLTKPSPITPLPQTLHPAHHFSRLAFSPVAQSSVPPSTISHSLAALENNLGILINIPPLLLQPLPPLPRLHPILLRPFQPLRPQALIHRRLRIITPAETSIQKPAGVAFFERGHNFGTAHVVFGVQHGMHLGFSRAPEGEGVALKVVRSWG